MEGGKGPLRRELKYRSDTCGARAHADGISRPIEVAISTLDQTVGHVTVRAALLRAKVVEGGNRPSGSDFVNRTTAKGAEIGIAICPADRGQSVEVAVTAKNQLAIRIRTAGTANLSAETIERRQRSGRGDLVHRTVVAAPAPKSGTVEIPVGSLNERATGISSMVEVEGAERGESLCRGGNRCCNTEGNNEEGRDEFRFTHNCLREISQE